MCPGGLFYYPATNGVVDLLKILTKNVVFLQSEKSFLKPCTERSKCHRNMIWVSNMLLMIKGTRCKKVHDHMSPLTIFRRGNVILVCIFLEIFRFERRNMSIFTRFNWRATPLFLGIFWNSKACRKFSRHHNTMIWVFKMFY